MPTCWLLCQTNDAQQRAFTDVFAAASLWQAKVKGAELVIEEAATKGQTNIRRFGNF
jgi:hypothetical protein